MMRRVSQNINKGEKSDSLLLNLGFAIATPLHLRLVLATYLLVMAICSMVFVGIVAAHSAVDPEISKITAKLIDEPNNIDLLLRRGQLYRFNGKFTESLSDLDQAWQLDRTNERIILERSRTFVALGRESEAQAGFEQCLEGKTGVSRVVPLVERAHLYTRTGQSTLAIADFSEALHLYPTVELYLIRGHLQEGLGRLDAAAAGYREGLSRLQQVSILRRELIRIKIVQGRYPEALTIIDKELASALVKTEWYLRRAEVLNAMGQTEAMDTARTQALSEANRAFAKRPTALHRVARAKVYQALGQIEAAKQDLRLAIQTAPRFTEAQDLLNKLEVP